MLLYPLHFSVSGSLETAVIAIGILVIASIIFVVIYRVCCQRRHSDPESASLLHHKRTNRPTDDLVYGMYYDLPSETHYDYSHVKTGNPSVFSHIRNFMGNVVNKLKFKFAWIWASPPDAPPIDLRQCPWDQSFQPLGSLVQPPPPEPDCFTDFRMPVTATISATATGRYTDDSSFRRING